MKELADLSEADLTEITADGVWNLARMVEELFRPHNIFPKVAVYAPNDLDYGMARIYSAHAEKFEAHRVFRDFDEARAWLLADNENDV
jgi:hypothetical protein